jgi:hypothetical protein
MVPRVSSSTSLSNPFCRILPSMSPLRALFLHPPSVFLSDAPSILERPSAFTVERPLMRPRPVEVALDHHQRPFERPKSCTEYRFHRSQLFQRMSLRVSCRPHRRTSVGRTIDIPSSASFDFAVGTFVGRTINGSRAFFDSLSHVSSVSLSSALERLLCRLATCRGRPTAECPAQYLRRCTVECPAGLPRVPCRDPCRVSLRLLQQTTV